MPLGKRPGRSAWNVSMFIISYAISNLVSGVIYDTYVNYMQEVAYPVATSFWAFYGYATFISAFLLLLVPSVGYKKLLLFCVGACVAALGAAIVMDSPLVFFVTTLLSLVGIQLHYVMLSPFIAVFTNEENKIRWYTRAYYLGYLGYFITTYLGGVLTVKLFSLRAGVTYGAAKALTEYVADLAPGLKSAYLQGNRDVLLLTAIIAALSIIPVLLIREEKKDYRFASRVSFRRQAVEIGRAICRRDTLVHLTYWALINFGMGLFTSYYTVFLNRNLHIDKATSSLLVSLSYLAIVIFLFFTPMVVKKCGQIVTLCGVALLSIPFMLIIANGDRFGAYTIPVVGAALFLRAGLANLSGPVDSSLAMELVPDHLRPAYASAVNIVAGLASIASGHFTGQFLFVTQEGYRSAYFIASVLYTVACVLLMLCLWKYNRSAKKEEPNA